MLRTTCLVLAALCWMLLALACLVIFVLVFKPRATDADQLPATVLYAASITCGVLSLSVGAWTWHRERVLHSTVRSSMLAAAVGLIIPALIVHGLMSRP